MPFIKESHLHCRKQKPHVLETLYKSQPADSNTSPVFILFIYKTLNYLLRFIFSFVLIYIINNELTALHHPILNIFKLFLIHLANLVWLNRKGIT